MSLASEYTATEVTVVDLIVKLFMETKLVYQYCISKTVSSERGTESCQEVRLLIVLYNDLVMNLVTGPRGKDSAMIWPVKQARS